MVRHKVVATDLGRHICFTISHVLMLTPNPISHNYDLLKRPSPCYNCSGDNTLTFMLRSFQTQHLAEHASISMTRS